MIALVYNDVKLLWRAGFGTMPAMAALPDQQELIGYLVRDIPREVMTKLRAAAAIHKMPLKRYVRELFEAHIEELERKGLTLSATPPRRAKSKAKSSS